MTIILIEKKSAFAELAHTARAPHTRLMRASSSDDGDMKLVICDKWYVFPLRWRMPVLTYLIYLSLPWPSILVINEDGYHASRPSRYRGEPHHVMMTLHHFMKWYFTGSNGTGNDIMLRHVSSTASYQAKISPRLAFNFSNRVMGDSPHFI